MRALIAFLSQGDVKQFIREHAGTDHNQLILNPPAAFRDGIKAIAAQIQARQKARGKLDDWATNFDLILPPPLSIEQASSNATCAYKQQLISGRHLIDLTGGMGIDLLAMGLSFEQATYVEKEAPLCDVFRHNCEVLSRDIAVVNLEATAFLKSHASDPAKTVIYLDPARRDEHKSRVFKMEDCSPNLVELLPLLQQKAGRVLVKYSPILDIRAILEVVPHIAAVHVVSVKNDCKELLILIDFSFDGAPRITCANLESGQPNYDFLLADEKTATADVGPMAGFLLEPNSSIMKAGAFKKIALDFRLKKMGEHTHLYTADRLVEQFPGRTFEVLALADKRTIKQYAAGGKINVITRNYPLSADALKKKWKLKDGGDFFLLAFRDHADKAQMVIAKRAHP